MTGYLEGIDVSHHQGSVDHQAVADSGMLFCMVKATEGADYEDPKFAENIKRIGQVQGRTYYPGATHYARPDNRQGRQGGEVEGNWFCDVVERVCGDVRHNFMPPALDFEKYSESDVKDNVPWIQGWIDVVERRLGRRPAIYTGANVWRYEVGNSDAFIEHPLWQVYYSGTATQPPSMPWPTWSMWQYSGGGDFQHHPPVPGVGVVDVDRFAGSLADLDSFAEASPRVAQSATATRPVRTARQLQRIHSACAGAFVGASVRADWTCGA